MKTRILGTATEYRTDNDILLFAVDSYYGGRVGIGGAGSVPMTTLKDIESYAKQLLEAVEAAKLVINMNERG